MKAIRIILLLALSWMLAGCMTYSSVARAKGHAGKVVEIREGDRIIRSDGTNCVVRRVSSKGAEEMRLHLITGYVCQPAYYALLPLTIPADIVTFPFQWLFAPLFAPIG